MGEFARESVLHAWIAAFVFAALVRTWRVDDPAGRVALGWTALAAATLSTPLLWLVAPRPRHEPWETTRALFDSARWNDVRIAGFGLADVVLAVLVLGGLLLFLRDALPWLRERAGSQPTPAAASRGAGDRVSAAVADVAARMRVDPPALHLIDDEVPVLLCTGFLRPELVVSRGAERRLDDAALAAAVAHELAHLERGDTRLGWLLMAVRTVFWFNPIVQVLARDLVQEIERRADDRSAEVTGDRLALAASLLAVFAGGEGARRTALGWPIPGLDEPGQVIDRFRAAAIEARCRRLLAPPLAPADPVVARLRVALTATGLGGLLFFVV